MTLEVRPRSASGLIFHVGTRRSHHLLLYMEETKVVGGVASSQVFRGSGRLLPIPLSSLGSNAFVSHTRSL